MMQFIHDFLSAIVDIINSTGYWGIAIGMLIESACIPLPSEIVLPLGGFMVSNGAISMLGANIAVAVGSMIGSLTAYAAGYYGSRPFILKYGKYFFVSEKHFHQAESVFNKYGSSAVFFGRLLPIVRTFISLPAGIVRMNIQKFIIYSMIGMIPWNFMLIFLGFKFGQQYEKIIHPIFQKFEYIIIGLIILTVLFFVGKSILKKYKIIFHKS